LPHCERLSETGTNGISVRERTDLIHRLKVGRPNHFGSLLDFAGNGFPNSVGAIGMGDPPKSDLAGLTLR
jgi:hypothetical protein